MAFASSSTSFAARNAISSSTSTSQRNTNNYVYDVFINHRGPDVKKGLASHIYRRLTVHGLRVFLDIEEMQVGENLTPQIEDAIRTASVHVAIFSPRYAESSWCLNELVQMLESGSTTIPVFYDVSPSELRWTRGGDIEVYARILSIVRCILPCTQGEDGGYARALRVLATKTTCDPQTNKKKPRHDSRTIEKWRNALSDVSKISGFELNACNGDEGLFVDKVVQQVLKKVRRTPLNVAKYPTGLDEKVKDVETAVLSQQQSGNLARVVGIVGLGGVGKTTLAKELFNRYTSNYERCCFVYDVRESAARNSLNSLQTTLLKDLAQVNEQINKADEGIEKLRRYLPSSQRALIVLDDVDHIDQLDALFSPVKESIHSGSLILITSRNKNVLTSSGIVESSIYELKGLNTHHSRELFCCHAFDQPYPVKEFEELVEKFLDACQGLPLSLKVIGALIRGKDLTYWKFQLRKISKILHEDIRSTLKISYDNLDEEEKQIFLDIACFFIGEDRDTVIRIWDGSGWEGWLGLRNLENKCLVEMDGENRIKMHDHLRDLGRDLAEKEPPGNEIRLWRPTDIDLHNLSGQSPVRGISTVHGNVPEESFENLADLAGSRLLANLRRLQLLRAESYFVERVFSVGHLPQLIYLRWDSCPYSSFPSSIPIKNLRVLYIEGETLETIWEHESQAPLELRELNIRAKLIKIQETIGELKHLEKFVLCSNGLETLPDSVGNLTSLQIIDLGGCSELRILPDSFGNLTNLQYINFSDCSNLQILPDSVRNLKNLEILVLGGCSALQMLPYSVGNMTNLESLNLFGCSALQMLPDSVGNMTNLQRLYLRSCSALQMLPDSVGNMTNLQSLDLSRCSALQMLPNSVGNMTNLQSLNLFGCSALQTLPDSFGNMKNLQRLDLRRCYALKMLPDTVGNMMNLRTLDLWWCSALDMLPDSVGNMANLQSLGLLGCFALQMLPDSIGNMRNLQILSLEGCSALQMLPDSLGNMRNLRYLDLRRCSALQMLPTVEHLSSLEKLNVSECPNLQWGGGAVEKLRQRLKENFIE